MTDSCRFRFGLISQPKIPGIKTHLEEGLMINSNNHPWTILILTNERHTIKAVTSAFALP